MTMRRVSLFLIGFISLLYSIAILAERVFVFDPNRLRWYAYQDGELIGDGPASGGKHYCPDVGRSCRTPAGVFRVYTKRGANCVSSKFPVNKNKPRARMPYCTFFRGGYAIHGSNHVPNYNASHGCIRVHPGDAKWLHSHFLTIGTKVVVRPYRHKKSHTRKRRR